MESLPAPCEEGPASSSRKLNVKPKSHICSVKEQGSPHHTGCETPARHHPVHQGWGSRHSHPPRRAGIAILCSGKPSTNQPSIYLQIFRRKLTMQSLHWDSSKMSDENNRKTHDSKSEIKMTPCLNELVCTSWSVLNFLSSKWSYMEQDSDGQARGFTMKLVQ